MENRRISDPNRTEARSECAVAGTVAARLFISRPQIINIRRWTAAIAVRDAGRRFLPVTERRVSTAGWIVFSALLVFTVIFFWIGLLMKENVAVCPVCKFRLS